MKYKPITQVEFGQLTTSVLSFLAMKFSTAFALLSTFVVSISAAAPPVPDVSNVECNCRG